MQIDATMASALWSGSEAPIRNVDDAAREFEGLLLGQMLKAMRGDGGWLGSEAGEGDSSMLEFGEQQLAQVLAMQGGLGLATALVGSLNSPGHADR